MYILLQVRQSRGSAFSASSSVLVTAALTRTSCVTGSVTVMMAPMRPAVVCIFALIVIIIIIIVILY